MRRALEFVAILAASWVLVLLLIAVLPWVLRQVITTEGLATAALGISLAALLLAASVCRGGRP